MRAARARDAVKHRGAIAGNPDADAIGGCLEARGARNPELRIPVLAKGDRSRASAPQGWGRPLRRGQCRS